jgi:predicted nucleotidyltransferase
MNCGEKLDIIVKELLEIVPGVLSICSYGSVFTDEYTKYSDLDLLIISKSNIDIDTLNKLRSYRQDCLRGRTKLDIALHSVDEILSYKEQRFWHNNRSLLFLLEIKLFGKVLYGENYFQNMDFDRQYIERESKYMLCSLKYNFTKMYLREESQDKIKKLSIKYALYSILYVLTSINIYPKTKKEAYDFFDKRFKSPHFSYGVVKDQNE